MGKCPITGLPCLHKKCIHVTEVSNYQATEVKDMCMACGIPYIAKEGGPQFDPVTNQVFQMVNQVIKNTEIPHGKIVLQPKQGCPACGHTLENILNTGKIGCGNCYEFYKKKLLPIIEKCQFGAIQHVGKIPRKTGPESLKKLEDDLKAAIEKEDYEKAAALRNEINKLKQ